METREYSKSTIRAFPQAFRMAMDVLKEQDQRPCAILRHLHGHDDVLPRYESSECWVYPSTKGGMVVGATVPDWRYCRFPTKNEDVRDLLADFFHFCEQYVARGRAFRISGAAALTFHRPYEFRYGGLARLPANGNVLERSSAIKDLLFQHDRTRQTPSGRAQREFAAWVDTLNTLDPMIHRAMFQYWRAVKLAESDFWEESITALDGLTSVAAEAIQKWMKLSPTRTEVGRILDMDEEDQEQLKTLYELRCDFGAHPSPAKWWDFTEIYETELDDFFEISKRLMSRLCRLERQFRSIDPIPSSWSLWFQQNAYELIDAVWFTRVR